MGITFVVCVLAFRRGIVGEIAFRLKRWIGGTSKNFIPVRGEFVEPWAGYVASITYASVLRRAQDERGFLEVTLVIVINSGANLAA